MSKAMLKRSKSDSASLIYKEIIKLVMDEENE